MTASINAALEGIKGLFGKAQVFVSNLSHEDYVKLAEKQGEKLRELSEIIRVQAEQAEQVAKEYNALVADLEDEKRTVGILRRKVMENVGYQNHLLHKIQTAKEALS